MRTALAIAVTSLALPLAGCGGRSVATQNDATVTQATAELVTPTPAPTLDADSVPVGDPATPAADAAETGQTTPAEAGDAVENYYAAIDRGDFDSAYALWGDGGQASKQSFADFKRGFAETQGSAVETGAPTNGEGAAGSVYIDVPVTVTATLKDGTEQRFSGTYTLRRVNDVPGATPEQLSWHIASAKLSKS